MALSSTANRSGPYSGNGVTTNFAFPYEFIANADLKVILRTTLTGAEVTQTLTTHYTVSGAGNPSGGSVTMLTAPASGETLTIYRDPSPVQALNLGENDPFPAESLEDQLDYLTMLIQRALDLVGRAMRLTDGSGTAFDPKLPALLVPEAVLQTKADGTGFEYIAAVDFVGATGPAGPQGATGATGAAGAAGVGVPAGGTVSQILAKNTNTDFDTIWLDNPVFLLVTQVHGSRAAPDNITAAGGIAADMLYYNQIHFVNGDGGPISVVANPQISAGNQVGQRLTLILRDATNTLTFTDNNGLSLGGGPLVMDALDQIEEFIWDGTNWVLKR